MSNKVTSLLRSRNLEVGFTAKSILLFMGDLASDEGEGIWASKTTIADELETTKRTIRRTINTLIELGFLSVVGQRKNKNGYTIEYSIDVKKVHNCSKIKPEPQTQCQGQTQDIDSMAQDIGGDTPSPLTHRPPTGDTLSPQEGTHCPPNHPITIHEPSNKDHFHENGSFEFVPASNDNFERRSNLEQDLTFSRFWEEWPMSKVGKQRAETAFKRISKQNKKLAIERAKEFCANWRAAYPQASDLHASSYLNGKRWNDEFTPQQQNVASMSEKRARWKKIAAVGHS